MAQSSKFWNGIALGDATEAPYDAMNEFSEVLTDLAGVRSVAATNLGAVFAGALNELATTGSSSPVATASGCAIVHGEWFENTASINTAISTPSAGNIRIDRLVLRKTWATQEVRLFLIAGTPAASPSAPALVQIDGTTWDVPLYQARITDAGVITLTDERVFVGGAGLRGLTNIKIVDKNGRGDHTTVTAALAAITNATYQNQWLILITGGDYTETAPWTLKEYVHIAGFSAAGTLASGGLAIGAVPKIKATTASTFLPSTNNVRISNLTFVGNNNPGDVLYNFSSSHNAMSFFNVTFDCSLSGAAGTIAGSQEFTDCHFFGSASQVGWFTLSSSAATPAVFKNCQFTYLRMAGAGIGQFDSCRFEGDIVMTALLHMLNGCSLHVLATNTTQTIISGKWSGGSVLCRQSLNGQSVWPDLVGPCTFVGTSFDQSIGQTSGTVRCGRIISMAAGPIEFTGCNFSAGLAAPSQNGSLIHFGSALVPAKEIYTVKFTGCNFANLATGGAVNQAIFTADAITGTLLIELNGNTYRGGWTKLASNIKFRGTDVRSTFFPYTQVSGATESIVDRHPVANMAVATNKVYFPLRMHPPAPYVRTGSALDDGIIDAILVCSGEVSLTTDTFTDVDTTNLSAHVANTGETWTARTGVITIVSNKAHQGISTTALYTVSSGTKDGYATVKVTGESTVDNAGILFRWADASNYWRLTYGLGSPSTVRLTKRVAAAETVVFETQMFTSFSGEIAVTFIAGKIIVYIGRQPVFETTDTALATNTGVGLYGNTGNDSGIDWDDFEFRSSDDVDITINSIYGQEGAPLDNQSDTLVLAALGVVHQIFEYVDISTALSGMRAQDIAGVEVELDALGGTITNLYLHGILLRYIPIVNKQIFSAIEDYAEDMQIR